MPIGFDVNTVKSTKVYFGTKANLYESFQKGNLMMRPYLRYQPIDLAVAEVKPPTLELGIYPNPASNYLRVESAEEHNGLKYSITNLSGQLVQTGIVESEIRFGIGINSGVYLLRIEDPSGKKAPLVKKILVKR